MTTKRQQYGQSLSKINQLSPEGRFFRTMTFKEVQSWLKSYNNDKATGYPEDIAIQRAWDCHFAAKRTKQYKDLQIY
jgi:hypothetical protein